MARKRANHNDRRGELIALSRIRIDPPDHVPLNEEEEIEFRAIISTRAPDDWAPVDVPQVARLAKIEVQARELWDVCQLLGFVDAGTDARKGGPSAELQAFKVVFDITMKLRVHLKLSVPGEVARVRQQGQYVRRAGAMIDAALADDDDCLLASPD